MLMFYLLSINMQMYITLKEIMSIASAWSLKFFKKQEN